jgi:hypothetical protein
VKSPNDSTERAFIKLRPNAPWIQKLPDCELNDYSKNGPSVSEYMAFNVEVAISKSYRAEMLQTSRFGANNRTIPSPFWGSIQCPCPAMRTWYASFS